MIKAMCKTENCGTILFDCDGVEHLTNTKIDCRGCGAHYRVKIIPRGDNRPPAVYLMQGNTNLGAVERYG